MTDKEVLRKLEFLVSGESAQMPPDYVLEMETAISALRERIERSKGCTFCYTDCKHNPFVSGYKFCPMCGRPLQPPKAD